MNAFHLFDGTKQGTGVQIRQMTATKFVLKSAQRREYFSVSCWIHRKYTNECPSVASVASHKTFAYWQWSVRCDLLTYPVQKGPSAGMGIKRSSSIRVTRWFCRLFHTRGFNVPVGRPVFIMPIAGPGLEVRQERLCLFGVLQLPWNSAQNNQLRQFPISGRREMADEYLENYFYPEALFRAAFVASEFQELRKDVTDVGEAMHVISLDLPDEAAEEPFLADDITRIPGERVRSEISSGFRKELVQRDSRWGKP